MSNGCATTRTVRSDRRAVLTGADVEQGYGDTICRLTFGSAIAGTLAPSVHSLLVPEREQGKITDQRRGGCDAGWL